LNVGRRAKEKKNKKEIFELILVKIEGRNYV